MLHPLSPQHYYTHGEAERALAHVAPAVRGFFRSVALGQAVGDRTGNLQVCVCVVPRVHVLLYWLRLHGHAWVCLHAVYLSATQCVCVQIALHAAALRMYWEEGSTKLGCRVRVPNRVSEETPDQGNGRIFDQLAGLHGRTITMPSLSSLQVHTLTHQHTNTHIHACH